MPPVASTYGPAIDAQFRVTYIAMGIVFVAAQMGLGLFVWKYRDRERTQVDYSHGNLRLEFTWTVLTLILFVGLNLMGQHIWAQARFQGASPGAMQVEVTGQQFAWYFRYPGPDGTFGKVNPKDEDASAGGEAALGLDTTDPASKDDIVTSTLVLPVNREVEIILRSQDVIHDFYVRELRFKQDAVPGLLIHLHFTPDKVGEYEVACAELCGLGHYKMRATLRVVSDDEFAKWQAARLAEKQ
jgi:cytochrome c oxidase subunit 2